MPHVGYLLTIPANQTPEDEQTRNNSQNISRHSISGENSSPWATREGNTPVSQSTPHNTPLKNLPGLKFIFRTTDMFMYKSERCEGK